MKTKLVNAFKYQEERNNSFSVPGRNPINYLKIFNEPFTFEGVKRFLINLYNLPEDIYKDDGGRSHFYNEDCLNIYFDDTDDYDDLEENVDIVGNFVIRYNDSDIYGLFKLIKTLVPEDFEIK